MIKYVQMALALVFFALPLQADPIKLTVDTELVNHRAALRVVAESEHVRLVSVDPRREMENFMKTKFTSCQEGLPGATYQWEWLERRLFRRYNLSASQLYKLEKVDGGDFLGYVDFAQMPTKVNTGDGIGYSLDDHEVIVQLFRTLGVNGADNERFDGLGLASILPVFSESGEIDQELRTEAFKLSLDALKLLSPHFPILNSAGTKLLSPEQLPEHWEVILANIDFEIQEAISHQYTGEVPLVHKQKAAAARAEYERVYEDAFAEEVHEVTTVMPGETDRMARQVMGLFHPEDPKRILLENAGFVRRQDEGFHKFYDKPRDVLSALL